MNLKIRLIFSLICLILVSAFNTQEHQVDVNTDIKIQASKNTNPIFLEGNSEPNVNVAILGWLFGECTKSRDQYYCPHNGGRYSSKSACEAVCVPPPE